MSEPTGQQKQEDGSMSDLYKLIKDYINVANIHISQIRAMSGHANVLRAKRMGAIPAAGVINEGGHYCFHGMGCRVTTDNYAVDFDFNENGAAEVFNAWRLWDFAQSCSQKYQNVENRDVLETALEAMVDSGIIEKTEAYSDSSLYRLKVNHAGLTKAR